MKILLINGGPHEKGCTYTALCEAAGIKLPRQEERRIATNFIR